jgi:hypothetical protein
VKLESFLVKKVTNEEHFRKKDALYQECADKIHNIFYRDRKEFSSGDVLSILFNYFGAAIQGTDIDPDDAIEIFTKLVKYKKPVYVEMKFK